MLSLRLLALAILVIASTATSRAEDKPVPKPYIEPGDCWSYRSVNMTYQNKPIGDYELCVTLVDASKNIIHAVATTTDDQREIDVSYSLEWAGYVSVWGAISTNGTRHFQFPMRVGDTYEYAYDFQLARRGPNAGKGNYSMKVVGWEDVTVPAGTFRALRIEGNGRAQRYDRPGNYSQSIVWWYSPKVGRWIKMSYDSPARAFGEELTDYHLKQ